MIHQAPPKRSSKRTLQSETICSPSIRRTSSRPENVAERWHVKRASSMPNECNMATEAVPNEIPTKCNIVTEAVPNAILNVQDLAIELVPNEIEYDHQAYWIAYRMTSRQTVKITTNGWWLRSHSNGYHCWRTSHGDRENYRKPYCTKPLTAMHTALHTEGSKPIAEWHTELNDKPHCQRPTKWLLRNKRIFYWSCLQWWPQRSTETLPNTASRDGEIYIYNLQRGFLRAEARSYRGEYDHPVWSLHVRYGSMI